MSVVQVRAARAKNSAAAIAADIAAEGYDSDEEVYATAKALEAEEGNGEDDVAAKVGFTVWLLFGIRCCPCQTALFVCELAQEHRGDVDDNCIQRSPSAHVCFD